MTSCYSLTDLPVRVGYGEENAVSKEALTARAATRRLKALGAYEDIYTPLDGYIDRVQRQGMTVEWRSKMVTWYHQLADSFNLDVTTIYAATNYLDRFLSKKSCNSVNFRLAAIGCLFLAAKVEERTPILAAHFCELSEGLFEPTDLRMMELDLLRTLRWRLYPTTPFAFAGLLAHLFDGSRDATETIEQRTTALLSLTLYDVELLRYAPSMQAVAAMICAMKDLGVASSDVRRWLDRVNACEFSYRTDPDAGEKIRDCGARFYAHVAQSKEAYSDADLEVELAMKNKHRGHHDASEEEEEEEEEEELAAAAAPRRDHGGSDYEAGLAKGKPLEDDAAESREHAPSPDGVTEIAAAIEEAVRLGGGGVASSSSHACSRTFQKETSRQQPASFDEGSGGGPRDDDGDDGDDAAAKTTTRSIVRDGAVNAVATSLLARGAPPPPPGFLLGQTATNPSSSLERHASEATLVVDVDLDDPRLRGDSASPRANKAAPPATIAGDNPECGRHRALSSDSDLTAPESLTCRRDDRKRSRRER